MKVGGKSIRRPTLRGTRDWFREQAEREDLPGADRRLWGMLADELDRRLPPDDPYGEDPPLFDA